jgi:lipopolysaccharide transport system permease protein
METRVPPVKAVLVLSPKSGRLVASITELWHFRELLYFLTWRDLKVRYKQTALGAAWAILQPLLTMLIFTLFFGRVVKVPSDGIPYPLFSYTGLLIWTYFANSITNASMSVVGNAALITKIYMPRMGLVIGPIFAALVDFGLGFILLLGLMLWYGIVPPAAVLVLPALVLLTLLFALGVGLLLAALNVKYRDIRYAIPFLIQIWLFSTPIAYPASLIHGTWRTVYAANPMVSIVNGFRYALLGDSPGSLSGYIVSVAVILTILALGLFYFHRTERSFADVI